MQAERAKDAPVDLITVYTRYSGHAPADTRVVLFGGKARLSGFWQEDDVVAKMAASDPDRYLGFLTLDLSQPDWRNDLERGHRDLKLRGVKLMPINRDTARLLFG